RRLADCFDRRVWPVARHHDSVVCGGNLHDTIKSPVRTDDFVEAAFNRLRPHVWTPRVDVDANCARGGLRRDTDRFRHLTARIRIDHQQTHQRLSRCPRIPWMAVAVTRTMPWTAS